MANNFKFCYYFLLYGSVLTIIKAVSYCPNSEPRSPSLYEDYCCLDCNRGKSFIVPATTSEANQYVMCPAEIPGSCSTLIVPTFCSTVLKCNSSATSGYHDITLSNGTTITVYCDMEGVNCDGEGGWMRVAHLNMSDPTEQCPLGFRLYEQNGVRACGRQSGGCESVVFNTLYNISYSQVCGRVTGYQKGSTDAIHPSGSIVHNIERAYADGVSITRGSNPRKHIWTFMAAIQENSFNDNGEYVCPCAPNSPLTIQSFIGDDYFCESGSPGKWNFTTLYTNDPLWDGEQCGLIEQECCNVTGIPWFNKVLEQPTTDHIELRVCCDQSINDEDNPVELYEIYIK